MAGQAARADFFRGRSLKDKYLRFIASASDVRFARTVTSFAALKAASATRIQSCLPMRRLLERAIDVVVASLARF